MAATAHQSGIRIVGANGQISPGTQFAGRRLTVAPDHDATCGRK